MGQGIKTRIEHAATTREGMAERMFAKTDTNKDGKVSLAEMQAVALSHFDQMDLNHDGAITSDERQRARQLWKAKRTKS